ncbi:MAG: glycosyltransferase [Planctomycetota bacterium]
MTAGVTASPAVSTIIAAHNAEATIATTLASLRAQSIDTWEVIVVDDGSTDRTAAAVQRVGDPRVRLVSITPSGVGAARNAGVRHATGDHFHFLDADDRLLPGAYETLLRAANGVRGAVGGWVRTDPQGAMHAEFRPVTQDGTLADPFDHGGAATGAWIVPRDHLPSPPFDSTLRWAEDLDLLLRLHEAGVRFHACDDAVLDYRLSPASATTSLASDRGANWGATILAASKRRDLSPTHFGSRLAAIAMRLGAEAILRGAHANDAHALWAATTHDEPHHLDPTIAAIEVANAEANTIEWRSASQTTQHDRLERLGAWWASMPFATPVWIESASQELAVRLVSPTQIARTLLASIDPKRTIVVVGCGRNGSVLIREATRAGRRLDPRDDEPTIAHHIARAVQPLDAPWDSDAAVVVTPLDDEHLVRRLAARGTQPLRWRLAPPTCQLRDTLVRGAIGAHLGPISPAHNTPHQYPTDVEAA